MVKPRIFQEWILVSNQLTMVSVVVVVVVLCLLCTFVSYSSDMVPLIKVFHTRADINSIQLKLSSFHCFMVMKYSVLFIFHLSYLLSF